MKPLTKKQLNHLLTLGTLILSNKGLIELTRDLRRKYKINLTAHEWDPEYRAKLEKVGTKAKVKKEVEAYFEKSQAEDQSASGLTRTLTTIFAQAKDEKAKDVWSQLWPELSKGIGQAIENNLGEMTVAEALHKFGLNFLAGQIFVDEFTDFVITDELQAFPPEYLAAVITDDPDIVIAVAGPLAIQEEILERFKKAMLEKFPASSKSLNDRIAAACVAYQKMGLTDKEIVLKLYDLNPSRKDFDRELSRLETLIRKKRERMKKELDKRL